MNYENFGRCLLYDEMSEGETYYTAQQMSQIAELIGEALDASQPGLEGLKTIRRQCGEMRWDSGSALPRSNLVHGILLTAARFVGTPWPEGVNHDWEALTELANAHMAAA